MPLRQSPDRVTGRERPLYKRFARKAPEGDCLGIG